MNAEGLYQCASALPEPGGLPCVEIFTAADREKKTRTCKSSYKILSKSSVEFINQNLYYYCSQTKRYNESD